MSLLPDPKTRGPVPAIAESPGLYRDANETPAFEIKFLLTRPQAVQVQDRLLSQLALDPHADPALGGAYRVCSVYYDTDAFDVYQRSDGYRRRKFRIRRYGESDRVFLERKTKSDGRVRKRRTDITVEELAAMVHRTEEDCPAAWFAQQLAKRNLKPVCRVSYERVALIGAGSEGPIRVTFDRAAVGVPADSPVPELVDAGTPLLADEVIAEFKFLGSLPGIFKTTIEQMKLIPQSFSKYRRCLEATGLVSAGSGPNV